MGSSSSYFVAFVVVLVQIAYGGSNILIKLSFDKGLNQLVLIIYRHLIAMLILGPFAYVLERRQRSSLSFKLMVQIFVLALIGSTGWLNVLYVGLHYASATVATALNNVVPGLTFFMAFLLGMEKVKIRSRRSQAKVVGIFLCIAGSLVFTFWKGQYLFKSFTEKPLITIHTTNHVKENWIKGSGLILVANIAWSVQIILQAMILKVYPAPITINTLTCFFTLLQNAALAVIFGRDPSLWKLDWNVQLLTNVYCGVVNSTIGYYVQTWCINEKGPVFGTVFNPLQVMIVGIFSAVAFAEQFHVGSVVGAVLVIAGLYFVVWGKKMDNLVDDNTEDKEELGNEKNRGDYMTEAIEIKI